MMQTTDGMAVGEMYVCRLTGQVALVMKLLPMAQPLGLREMPRFRILLADSGIGPMRFHDVFDNFFTASLANLFLWKRLTQ